MPVAKFRLPDGRIARFNVPEGTTPEQAQQMIAQEIRRNPSILQAPPEEAPAASEEQAPPAQTVGSLAERFATAANQMRGLTPESLTGTVQPREEGLTNALANIGLEAMAAVNREATGIADFAAQLPNAVAQLSGQEQIPSLTETLSPATRGEFMEPGVARDVVRGAGEVAAAAAGGGALIRSAAQQLPRFGAATEGTVAGALRQAGTATPVQDIALGAASGAGAAAGGATGELIGGEEGRQVGELVGSLAAPVVAGVRPQRVPGRSEAQRVSSPAREAEGRAAQEATGVELLPAQRSLDPEQLRAQRFLPELTPATERAAAALSRQNEQAAAAVDDFVRAIGPGDAVETGAIRFRNASQRAIQKAKDIRKEKASPLYNEAFREGVEVDVTPIRASLQRIIDEFPDTGAVSNAAKRINKLLGEGDTSRLKRLHNVKLEIDEMLNKVGESSLGNTSKREVIDIKNQLLAEMENASPTYRQALERFAAESPRVTDLEESIIGKIANIDDTQLKSVSRRIFDPAESNPKVVMAAKKVIDDVDPDAWNRLMRAEVERRVGSIAPEIGTSFENVPGKLNRAIFGTGKNRQALLSGMNNQQRKNAEMLETALKRASLGRPGGSETAGRQQFIRELESGVVSAIRNFMREPIDRAIGVGEASAFDRKAKALADALFDPAFQKEASKALRDDSGDSFAFLLNRVFDTTQSALGAGEQGTAPPAQQQAPIQSSAPAQ